MTRSASSTPGRRRASLARRCLLPSRRAPARSPGQPTSLPSCRRPTHHRRLLLKIKTALGGGDGGGAGGGGGGGDGLNIM
jgi:hypothetical protein